MDPDLCDPEGLVVLLLYVACLVSHTRAAYSDPVSIKSQGDGSDDAKDVDTEAVTPRCPKCCSIKPPRTHHCRVCKRCILKMDHHCPWINNCVGLHNQKFFFLFTLYLTLLSSHLSVLITYRFIYGLSSEDNHNIFSPLIRHHIDVFLLLIVVIPALVFGLVMCSRQTWSILNNITTIEYKKEDKIHELHQSTFSSYTDVFGMRPCYEWLSPFHSPKIDIHSTSWGKYIRPT